MPVLGGLAVVVPVEDLSQCPWGLKCLCQSDRPSVCQIGHYLGANRVSILVPLGLSVSQLRGPSNHVPVELDSLVPVRVVHPLALGLFIPATVNPSISVPVEETIYAL